MAGARRCSGGGRRRVSTWRSSSSVQAPRVRLVARLRASCCRFIPTALCNGRSLLVLEVRYPIWVYPAAVAPCLCRSSSQAGMPRPTLLIAAESHPEIAVAGRVCKARERLPRGRSVRRVSPRRAAGKHVALRRLGAGALAAVWPMRGVEGRARPWVGACETPGRVLRFEDRLSSEFCMTSPKRPPGGRVGRGPGLQPAPWGGW